ncbi:efflux RND transporter permease subunit [Schaalia sp. ZJ1691]|uniref:efflux RND transporter permease subunit n=1 Tax=Schaalia sp. ZJ1691 TaxID=2709404 RepID=UPI0013EB06B3|nr:efflux RND transporter permease subunit [Schaalia sp. ZJ1691]
MLDRIAKFLVTGRVIITAIMVALTIACAFAIPRVGVISDMAKYLPHSSSMKQGIAIIDEEFPAETQDNTIRVMVSGLSQDKRDAMRTRLKALDHVSKVEYLRDSPDYNTDEHALYVLHTTAGYGSSEELAIERALTSDAFSDVSVEVRSDNPSPTSELPLWIVLVAISLLAAILFAMCHSWIEPILFFITIGMAIVLNLGTHIIRGSIADITFTIGAILQLVLSMDYSIILANRYRQERAKTPTHSDAMITAIRQSFSAITSASMTTIVGLLMLCFMSLLIGADLGIALAKGVFFSMLCVFTVLPTLILGCDRWIVASSKPALHINLRRIAGFEYRFRWFITGGFVVLFVGSLILSMGTPIAYTLDKKDPIAQVFPKTNPLVLVYRHEDEAAAAALADTLEDHAGVRTVDAYSTTLGRQRTVEDMTQFLATVDDTGTLNTSTVKMVYYLGHGEDGRRTMSAGEFLTFLASDLAKHPDFSTRLAGDLTKNISEIRRFADREALTEQLSISDLASFLKIDAAQVRRVLLASVIGSGQGDPGTMKLATFTRFITDELARNPDYSGQFSAETIGQLSQLRTFTNVGKMTRRTDPHNLAQILDEDPTAIAYAAMVYMADSGVYDASTMTLPQFVEVMNSEVAADPFFASAIDAKQREQLKTLATFTDTTAMTTPADSFALAKLLSLPTDQVSAILAAKAQSEGADPSSSLASTPADFVTFLCDTVLANPSSDAAQSFSPAQVTQLESLRRIINTARDGRALTPAQLAPIVGLNPRDVATIYAYSRFDEDASTWEVSPQTLVHFLIDHPEYAPTARLEDLDVAAAIIDTAVSGASLTPAEMAALLGIDAGQTRAAYLVYVAEHGDTSGWTMSVEGFLDYMVTTVLASPAAAGQFTDEQERHIRGAHALVNAVIADTPYSADDMASLLAFANPRTTAHDIAAAYLVAGMLENFDESWTMSLNEFFDVLATDVLDDSRLSGMIDTSTRKDIARQHQTLVDNLANLVGQHWSRLVITTIFPLESPETTEFIRSILHTCDEEFSGECHLVGQSAMIDELAASFPNENLLITGLTAASIFVVVAVAFFSLSVPLLLVLLVQCGVFMTTTVIGLQGYNNYYLAQLMVQCLLMGATIDYGIVLTTYYRQNRTSMGISRSLAAAYDGSIHTIATSGAIMVVITGILGFLFDNPTVGQICRTISIGAFTAISLIVFVLPALLACLDRFVGGRGRRRSLH